jgi:hypothetical protein
MTDDDLEKRVALELDGIESKGVDEQIAVFERVYKEFEQELS